MTNPLVWVLELPGRTAATAMNPVWDKKSQTVGYNTGYFTRQGEIDCLKDNLPKEVLVLRAADKENSQDWLEGIAFSQIKEYIKKGKIKREDMIYLHLAQPLPMLAEVGLAQFGIVDWSIEKKDQPSEIIEEVKKLLAGVVGAPTVAPASAPAPEMMQMMQMMQQMQKQNEKLEKQVEDLLAEKEVKKANPVT